MWFPDPDRHKHFLCAGHVLDNESTAAHNAGNAATVAHIKGHGHPDNFQTDVIDGDKGGRAAAKHGLADTNSFQCTNHMLPDILKNCGAPSKELYAHAIKCWDPKSLADVKRRFPAKLVKYLSPFEDRQLCKGFDVIWDPIPRVARPCTATHAQCAMLCLVVVRIEC